MSQVTSSYRGFRLVTLVFHDPAGDPSGKKHERLLAVSVRVTPDDSDDRVPSPESRVFRLESALFDSIGDARRAGDKFGRTLVDQLIDQTTAHAS